MVLLERKHGTERGLSWKYNLANYKHEALRTVGCGRFSGNSLLIGERKLMFLGFEAHKL